jgi:hypothetical protein
VEGDDDDDDHDLPFVFIDCPLYVVVSCLGCTVAVVLSVLLSSYVCIAVFTLSAGLLARSQYSEGPTTGLLNTGFSWFSCV